MTDPNKNQNDKNQSQRQPQKQDQGGGMKDRQPQKSGNVSRDPDDDQELNDIDEPGAQPSTQRVGNTDKPAKR
jgi:hypothetical protein